MPSADDVRSPFQHDVDRILYCNEFRALAGKTQVVAADQLGGYHNRLTHSLKVAQIGRRLAVLLTERAGADAVGPNPDLLEAACLIHDIGHPPFGHIGEHSLCATVDELRAEPGGGAPADGFQGNAQNLRIATYLAARAGARDQRGLLLSRATLDSATKYPWRRGEGDRDTSYAAEHWGCYEPEAEAVEWILQGVVQDSPVAKDAKEARPVEEEIMDWADEVTYACHDVEDFYRAGLIPLDQIFTLPLDNPRRQEQWPYETEKFLRYLEAKHEKKHPGAEFDSDAVRGHLREIANLLLPSGPYAGDFIAKQTTAAATSRLLTHFVSGVALLGHSDGPLTRYNARLDVPADRRAKVGLLNSLIKCYVIDRPGLAGQQRGQQRIVKDLTTWVAHEPARLLPPDRLEEYELHGDPVRSAADYVSSMTEGQALLLHRRMSGVDYGQITDLL